MLLVTGLGLVRIWKKFMQEAKRREKAQKVLQKASQHLELRTLQLQTFGRYSPSMSGSPTLQHRQSIHSVQVSEVDNISLIPPLLDANLLSDLQPQASCHSVGNDDTPIGDGEDFVDAKSDSFQMNKIALAFDEGPTTDTLSLHEAIVL